MKKGSNKSSILIVVGIIVVIAILIAIGCLISKKIAAKEAQDNETYGNAIHITSPEEFQKALDERLDNVYIYGDMIAIDPVSVDKIDGEYAYIKTVGEEYVKHTQTKKYTDSNGRKKTKTTTTHSWERFSSEELKCTKVSFCGVTFDVENVDLPSSNLKDTIKESEKIRYKYYVVDKQYTGTIYANLSNGTLEKDMKFYEGKNIDEVLNIMQTHNKVIMFWILYFIFIMLVVFGFVFLRN